MPAAAPEQVDAAEPPEDAPRRVLVVHQQATFGEALARRLSREPGLEVLGSVTRPVRAQVLVAARAVATVVLDWDLPQGASEQLALALRALDRPPVVVVLGEGEDEPSVVLRALAAGARAWVPKSASVELLLEVLRCTALGETWLSGRLLGRVLDHVLQQQREPASTSPLDVLTDRERDVLRCMVAGLGQAEIAARLFLSPNTVRTHRRRTLAKLGVHSSLEAAFVARRAGLSPHQPQG